MGGGDEARLDLGRRRAVDNDDDDLGDAARARAQASARAQERQRPGRAQRHDRQPTCARVRARLEPTMCAARLAPRGALVVRREYHGYLKPLVQPPRQPPSFLFCVFLIMLVGF